jgi:Rrf2 family protein
VITREADYAIRTVWYLARAYDQGPVSTTEIGEKMSIPYRFLRKISRQLVETGIVTAQRGKQGGIALAIPPGRLTLLDILKIFDQRAITFNACCEPQTDCERQEVCEMHHQFAAVQQEIHRQLKTVNFSRLVKPAV